MSLVLLIDSESEIIDSIFDACQTDLASPGLMLEDVQREACASTIDLWAGSNGNIDSLFQAVDTDGNGIVMRDEVNEAFKSFALLNRASAPDCKKRDVWFNHHKREEYYCNNMTTCCGYAGTVGMCPDCTCPESC